MAGMGRAEEVVYRRRRGEGGSGWVGRIAATRAQLGRVWDKEKRKLLLLSHFSFSFGLALAVHREGGDGVLHYFVHVRAYSSFSTYLLQLYQYVRTTLHRPALSRRGGICKASTVRNSSTERSRDRSMHQAGMHGSKTDLLAPRWTQRKTAGRFNCARHVITASPPTTGSSLQIGKNKSVCTTKKN
jgi:hypothetical protein